jgi:integrase
MARTPKLRKSSNGRAVVEYRRRRYWLGKYGSQEAEAAYQEWLAQFRAGELDNPGLPAIRRMSIASLAVRYLEFAESYSTPVDFVHVRETVRAVVKLFRNSDACDFGAPQLLSVQSELIRREYRHRTINNRIGRIRFWFRWAVAAVPESGVTGSQCADLATVVGIRAGRPNLEGLTATASRKIDPVAWSVAETVLPFLSADVAAMVHIQYACGMRPGEVVRMRECEIDTSGDVWFFAPADHKNAWRGKGLVKAIPASVQGVVASFFGRHPDAYMFQPGRPDKSNTSGKVGDHYTTTSYRRAVTRGIARARLAGFDVPSWTPNQLRHAIATDISSRFGQQAAQRWLGHDDLSTTAIYAESTRRELVEIAGLVDGFLTGD